MKHSLLILAVLAGTAADWIIGYRYGVESERKRALAKSHAVESELSRSRGQLRIAVASLKKANAEIDRANVVNGELHAKLRAARTAGR